MKLGTNIPTHVTSIILIRICFSDARLCKKEVFFKCFNSLFIKKVGIRQQGSPGRKPNHAVNSDDVQRESVIKFILGYMFELHQPVTSISRDDEFSFIFPRYLKKN